jgi:hypothetical protein
MDVHESEAASLLRGVAERRSVSGRDLSDLAGRLGHNHFRLHSTVSGPDYFATCSCGWASEIRFRQTAAVAGLRNHLLITVRQWDSSGVPLPKPS